MLEGGLSLITIDPRSSTPIYEQIVKQIRELIAKGVLSPGDRLPSVRELSELVMANPNTVSKAYQELERQKAIETLRGRGTFVSEGFRPELSDEALLRMKEQLRQIVIEAYYLGISQEGIGRLVEEVYHEFKRG